MSLRLRLLLMIGVSLSLLWSGVALWMLRDLDNEMRRTLDQRLAMSAQRSSDERERPGGQPSMTVPTPSPCDSPKIEMRNVRPKVFM